MVISSSLQFRNEQFFAKSNKSRDCAEAYRSYAAQTIPQIDAACPPVPCVADGSLSRRRGGREIAKKGHFLMETSLGHNRRDFLMRKKPTQDDLEKQLDQLSEQVARYKASEEDLREIEKNAFSNRSGNSHSNLCDRQATPHYLLQPGF